MYEGGWDLIDNRIHYFMGKALFQLGDVKEALEYFCKLIATRKHTASEQQIYIDEFLVIYEVCFLIRLGLL